MPTPPRVFISVTAAILIGFAGMVWVLFGAAKKNSDLAEGGKKYADPAVASFLAQGDAARALFDKEPDKKHLETALRHYQEAAALADKDKDPLAWADIQLRAGQTLFNLARYKEAEPMMRHALKIHEATYGKSHHTVAIGLNNLAQLLKSTNRMGEAEPIMRQAMESFEMSLGKNHRSTVIARENLEILRKEMGK